VEVGHALTFPRWRLPATDHLIDKERTEPDLGKRSRYLIMRQTESFPRTKSSVQYHMPPPYR